MLNPNQFVRDFDSMDLTKFALNFHKLRDLDVRIIEYMSALPAETIKGVSYTRVFRGNFSKLAEAIQYKDPCNIRKAVLRLENIGILWCGRNDKHRVHSIILNKYWMLRVRDHMG